MKLISLENFNPKSRKEPLINSPRSLEACRRQGILPNELILLSPDEIKTLYGDSKLESDGLDFVARHHEERRQEKVRVLLEERAQVIEEEQAGLISFSPRGGSKSKSQNSEMQSRSTFKGSMNIHTDSTLIDKERKQLEMIKQRQEKELQQMVDYEMKMAEIKAIQEQKMEKQRERDQQREREVSLRRQEAEARKLEQEREKRMKAEQEEEVRKTVVTEQYRREMKRAEQEKKREKKRKKEARKREEEQKKKQEEFVKATEQKLHEQQMVVDQKREYMEERDRIRLERLREEQWIKQQEAEEKRRYHEEKLEHAKEKNEQILLQKKLEYEERQMRNEERRKHFEKEMKRKKKENKLKAENKSVQIKKVLEENELIEESKRDQFYYKKALAEERKRELDAIAEEERQNKIREQREREMNRKNVKQNMENRLEGRTHGYLQKMEESDNKVKWVQHQKELSLKEKHALEVIRNHDKKENVMRIARMQEYQREKILEKIQHDTERANLIKQERQSLLEARMGIKRQVESSKRVMLEQFEDLKKGKTNPESMSLDFTRPSTAKNVSGSKLYGGSSRNMNRPQSSDMKLTSNNHQTSSTNATEYRQAGMKKQQKKEAKKIIEQLKSQQNHEMLLVLEEEQNKENEREYQLQQVTNKRERENLEKSFAGERARAHQRIQQLADFHDEAIRELMAQYNIKGKF